MLCIVCLENTELSRYQYSDKVIWVNHVSFFHEKKCSSKSLCESSYLGYAIPVYYGIIYRPYHEILSSGIWTLAVNYDER